VRRRGGREVVLEEIYAFSSSSSTLHDWRRRGMIMYVDVLDSVQGYLMHSVVGFRWPRLPFHFTYHLI
jgi:hypothetical protein